MKAVLPLTSPILVKPSTSSGFLVKITFLKASFPSKTSFSVSTCFLPEA